MNKPKTILTAEITQPYLARLEEVCDLEVCGWVQTGDVMPEEECAVAFAQAEILIANYEPVTRQVMDSCPRLRLIACPRGNPVNIDVDAASERGIPVLYAPGRNANSVAEFLLGSVLGLIRHIARSHHEVKNGRFLGESKDNVYNFAEKDDIVWGFAIQGANPFSEYTGFELFGKTFGMVGYGAVGRRIAKFLRAMDVNLLVYDPYLPPHMAEEEQVKLVTLEEVFSRSDFVSIQCKVTEETKGMIGTKEFALMKPTACFINTARGIIVDQKALVDALAENRIAGAALDVFWEEPMPANHPLLHMDNVLITPHIAGASRDVSVQHSAMIAGDVLRFLQGEALQYAFNRDRLK